jgi:O-antigen ligase
MYSQIHRLKALSVYLIAFALGCYIYAAPAVIAVFLITWLLEGRLKEKFAAIKNSKTAWLFSSFYLLHLIGMIYSYNTSFGWFDLEIKLSLFIFPLTLVSENVMDKREQRVFSEIFISGLVLNGLICLTHAAWLYFTQNKIVMQYKDFSLFLHPTYFSMYIDLALLFIFNLIVHHPPDLRKPEKLYLISSFFFLLFILILLQSKTGLLTSFIILTILLVRYILHKRSWKTGIAIVVASVFLTLFTSHYILNPGPSRFQSVSKLLEHNEPVDNKSIESSQARILVWQSAWQVIKNNPVFGVGTGDVKDALVAQYSKNNYTGIMKERLNAHNEYLQVTAALGITGLLCLLSCLVLPLYVGIQQKRFVYVLFILIMLINFLTESVLETQGGTIFYGFFNSLLMFNFVI